MKNDCILEFGRVRTVPRANHQGGMSDVNFSLDAGTIALVLLEGGSEHLPLCDLAEGLVNPDEGSIGFMGEMWDGMLPCRQDEMRGKIGRVFEHNGWVSNLSVYENITLARRHHTSSPDFEIRRDVEQLCRLTGLESVPDQRPDLLPMNILRRAEWVRAFLGSHVLFLLERPEHGAPAGSIERLFALVSKVLTGHSAVLWTTLDQQIWQTRAFKNVQRFKMFNGKMVGIGDT